MSKGVLSVIPYNRNNNDDSEEKSSSTQSSFMKLWKSTSVKLNILYDLGSMTSNHVKSNNIFFYLRKYYNHINFKFLPCLIYANSSKFTNRHHRFNRCQRRTALRSLVKAYSLAKQSKNKLYQKKVGYLSNESKYKDKTSEKSCKELYSQLRKEDGQTSNSNDPDLSKNIDNNIRISESNLQVTNVALDQMKQMADEISIHNIAELFAKLDLNQFKGENNTNDMSTTDVEKDLSNEFNGGSSTIACSKINYSKIIKEELNYRTFNKNSNKENLLLEYSSGYVDVEHKVDFSSGDDSRNKCSELQSLTDNIFNTKDPVQVRSQDFMYKIRSVQWNSEVDVIYYAGDADGGKIVWREREPLREEADQQERHNGFIRIALNKNLISSVNSYRSIDS